MTEMTRRALVTGASRGIGRAIALTLGRQGMEVYGTATGEAGVEDIRQIFSAENISGEAFIFHAEEPEAVQNLFADLPSAPDVLVNNAGITRDRLLMRMDAEDWDVVIQINLSALFHLCKAAARPMMKARWGRIINITSVSGLMGNAGQCNYAAAKAGVVGLSKSLARELASRNITVNCVAPGFIATDMTASLPEDLRKQLLSIIPAGRFGEPEDVAATVAFLASEEGGYITGETVSVNGGLYMQ